MPHDDIGALSQLLRWVQAMDTYRTPDIAGPEEMIKDEDEDDERVISTAPGQEKDPWGHIELAWSFARGIWFRRLLP